MTPNTGPIDTVRTLPNGAVIQYGAYNNRIYLMSLGKSTPKTFATELIERAKTGRYSKIFAEVPESQSAPFIEAGYVQEARIPNYYNGRDAANFFACYLNAERAQERDPTAFEVIVETAQTKPISPLPAVPLNKRFTLRPCTPKDAPNMAEIYRGIFKSYPFPIHNPDYIASIMESHVDYFAIETEGKIIALASAEMDTSAANVEMTDFATHPAWRGNRFASHLLAKMEKAMIAKGIKTAFTIARAASHGMNITFGQANYVFAGRLKNNTNISGNIESMNVWHKHLVGESA